MKKGSATWLWVIIIGLILGSLIVLLLLKFELRLVEVFIELFSGK